MAGEADKIKGTVKENVGKVTGDKRMESRGQDRQAEGRCQGRRQGREGRSEGRARQSLQGLSNALGELRAEGRTAWPGAPLLSCGRKTSR